MVHESWTVGEAYEAYVGRWSRQVASEFVRWLDLPDGLSWLDAGCGAGALTAAALASAPNRVLGMDTSAGFLSTARAAVIDPRATFLLGDASDLSLPDEQFDAVVSGLVLNFVPRPGEAVAEFSRVAKPSGVVAAYVWDYADGMQMLRYFWDAAAAIDPAAIALDEGRRFPLCSRAPLRDLWTRAGLREVSTHSIEVPTWFADFDDYWRPFLGAQGPAPGYVASLADDERQRLRERLRVDLPVRDDGSVHLTARAWAVRGRR